MRILFVSSECAPWSKTGGLGDVVGALPTALSDGGHGDVAVLTPLYTRVREACTQRGETLEDTGIRVSTWFGEERVTGRILAIAGATNPQWAFLECARFYERSGIYDGAEGSYGDNAYRFAFLCRAALDGAAELLGGPPDVVHAHDWPTGLVPLYLRTAYRHSLPHTVSAITIHNLAYQGLFDAADRERLGVPAHAFQPDGIEFHGHLNLLKGGIASADVVTTVSPRYASEIRTPAFGANLHGFLARRRVVGVLNGIDEETWDPANDPHLASSFDPSDLAGKQLCRQALLDEMGLTPAVGEPVLGVVSRFTSQKGLDLIADLVPELPRLGARLVVLGNGESGLERTFRALAARYPGHVATRVMFDVGLAHRITAGTDIMLMPSRFEPCGLNQLYAMRYGTVPVVHGVGGLRDTVRDPGDAGLVKGEGTGFVFDHPSLEGLRWAVRRAIGIYRHHPEGWGQILRAGMMRDSSWAPSAEVYARLYREAMDAR